MKKIIYISLLTLFIEAKKPPLVDVAQREEEFSIKYVNYERWQEKYLYDYVRLVKARYISTKEIIWLSHNIVEAIYLESKIIRLGQSYEN